MQRNNANDDTVTGEPGRAGSAPITSAATTPQPARRSIAKYARPWRAYFEDVGGRCRCRADVKPSGARDLLVALAGRWLQEVLLQVLDAEEKLLLRVRDTTLDLKLQADKFQRRNHVSDLEQLILFRRDIRDEFDLGGKERKGNPQDQRHIGLPVVIIDLQLVIGVEFCGMRREKRDNLLKQPIVQDAHIIDKSLVDGKHR